MSKLYIRDWQETETIRIGNRYSWGSWTEVNGLDKAPTIREVLNKMLETTPDHVLDSAITEQGKDGTEAIRVAVRKPAPSFEDPLGERGFVSFKFIYEDSDDE